VTTPTPERYFSTDLRTARDRFRSADRSARITAKLEEGLSLPEELEKKASS
jgi:hypothetical protein